MVSAISHIRRGTWPAPIFLALMLVLVWFSTSLFIVFSSGGCCPRPVFDSEGEDCGAVEDVQGVLTLFGRGKAQVCHVLRVRELSEQLEVEEEDGDRQEEEEEVESGEVESR